MHVLSSLVLLALLLSPTALWAGGASVAPDATPLAVGQTFPNVTLEGTLTAEQAAWLGIPAGTTAPTLSQIKAQAVILEVFSMYCPHCQAEAPSVVALHKEIAARGLDGTLKLIGLGAGNSQSDVDIYRTKYTIPFPLFTDFDYVVHKACGEVGTPYFYVLARQGKNFVVVVSSLGRMDSPAAFLDQAIQAAKLK